MTMTAAATATAAALPALVRMGGAAGDCLTWNASP